MVEIELSVIARQCLKRRLASISLLEQEVLALVAERNQIRATINWQFTPELARVKFTRFYPKLDPDPRTIIRTNSSSVSGSSL